MTYDRNTLQALDVELETREDDPAAQEAEISASDAQEMVAIALLGEEGAERIDFEPAEDGVAMQLFFDSEAIPVSLRPDNTLCVSGRPVAIVEEVDGQIISLGSDEPFTPAELAELVRNAVEHELSRPELESSPALDLQDESYLDDDDDLDPEPESPFEAPGWSIETADTVYGLD
jgi:hypothetical protein